ncbi:MAG: HEAT repeat domain-containing protein [Phycisphaerales bacterium]|nr:HEAT repeat domain-containing protein [Phycisphaerales bacterium]
MIELSVLMVALAQTAPEDRPVLPVAEQLQQFKTAEGWSVGCFASEEDFPELANPICMLFDGQGRLWVACAPTYPHLLPGEEPQDKLLILEDTDGDGRADKRTVFADGLYIPTGFVLSDEGAYVVDQPNLVHVRDLDGDDKADVKDIVLHGLGAEDSHHSMSAFTWHPDGAMYFQEGTFHHTQVETPYGPTRTHDGAVLRFDPRTWEVDVISSYPYANPWGHTVDPWGRSLITDASNGLSYRLLHVSGANPYPDPDKFQSPVRGRRSFTPGGRRPTAGTELLHGTHAPEDEQGRFLVTQSIGFHGLRWYELEDKDSGITAKTFNPELLQSSDPTCRPCDVEVGPDGAIYVLDWANPIVGHMQFNVRDERRDHAHGRVWRLTHDERELDTPAVVEGRSIGELLELLRHDNERTRMLARRELASFGAQAVLPEAVRWRNVISQEDADRERLVLETLWLHQSMGEPDPLLLDEVLSSEDPRVRAAGVRVLRWWLDDLEDPYSPLQKVALDGDSRARSEVIYALGFLDDPRALEILSLAMRQRVDDDTKGVLHRTARALERFGEVGGEGTEAWRLSRLSDSDLAAEPMDHFVAIEKMRRASLPLSSRRDAAAWLAEQSSRPVAAEVLATAVTLKDDDSGLGPLLAILLAEDSNQLQGMRRELQDAALDDSLPDQVQDAAIAALARADGFASAWDWAGSRRTTSARVSLLRGMHAMPEGELTDSRLNEAFDVLSGRLTDPPQEVVERPAARFVRISMNGSATLTLPEVEVLSGGSNVALNKPAQQSSTSWGGTAEKAVDGNADGRYGAGSSTHSNEGEDSPWWEVDLEQVYPLEGVRVYNRTDSDYGSRLNNFSVQLMDADRNTIWRQDGIARPRPDVLIETGGTGVPPVTGPVLQLLAVVDARADDARAILEPWARCADDNMRIEAAIALAALPEHARQGLAPELTLVRQPIRTIKDQMLYDVKSFEVAPGAPVEITLINDDAMPHNLVLCRRGALRKVGRASDAQGMGSDAAAREYVPDMPDDILHVMGLVLEGESKTIRFVAPDRPGRYPYVCTYPQHWQMMNGVLKVVRP